MYPFHADHVTVDADDRIIGSKFAYQPCNDGWIDEVPEGWVRAKFATKRDAQRVADKLDSIERFLGSWHCGRRTEVSAPSTRAFWTVRILADHPKLRRYTSHVVCVRDYDSPIYDD